MPEDTKIEDLNYYSDWLKRSIDDEYIKSYKYSNFKNIKKIGKGSFGNVVRANYTRNEVVALKSYILTEFRLKLRLNNNYNN